MVPIRSLIRLATALVIFAVVLPPGESTEIDLQSYLNLPTTKQLSSDSLSQDIRRALIRANVAPGSSRESIKDKLTELVAAEATKSSFRHIYRDLLELANLEDDYCSSELLDVFHSIMAQITTEDGKQLDAAFSDYLKSYGPAKFAHCAAKENENFRLRPHRLMPFGAVYRHALDIIDSNKLLLYQRLKGFDPTHDAFNVPKMVEAARGFVKDQQRAQSDDEFVVIDSFMRSTCKQLDESLPPRSRVYKIISLNRFFGSQVDFDTSLLLENEYHRLCLAWDKQHDVLERNIRSQVVKKRWLGLNFGLFKAAKSKQ